MKIQNAICDLKFMLSIGAFLIKLETFSFLSHGILKEVFVWSVTGYYYYFLFQWAGRTTMICHYR